MADEAGALTLESDQDRTRHVEESILRRINHSLPDDIRVIGISRVTKTFNARRRCAARSYEYVLPYRALGGSEDDSAEDKQKRVDKFREILAMYKVVVCLTSGIKEKPMYKTRCIPPSLDWALFFFKKKNENRHQGCHAFHNYTRMKVYDESRSKTPRRDYRTEGAVSNGGSQPAPLAAHERAFGHRAAFTSEAQNDEDDDDADGDEGRDPCDIEDPPDSFPSFVDIRWMKQPREGDRVLPQHYRTIFGEGDLLKIGRLSLPLSLYLMCVCVRVCVCCSSFILLACRL